MIALTHIPSPKLPDAVRTYVPHSAIDPAIALVQHAAYRQLLADCGAQVVALDVNAGLPDSTFIEDTAVVLNEVAVLCSPGTASRRAEPAGIEPVLREYREVIRIHPPANLEGGDVLRVGRTLLVGQSPRTNSAGIAALSVVAKRFGHRVVRVPLCGCLHLKTACTALPDGRLLANTDWLEVSALEGFTVLPVPNQEPWSANVALVGENVLLAAQHPSTADFIRGLGFIVRPIDISEFAKAEGGVTCLSLFIA